MYYGKKSLEQIDEYYGINVKVCREYPEWKVDDCKKIQKSFKNSGIDLTLAECREMYSIYSDESFCSGWSDYIEDCTEDDLFNLLKVWLIKIMEDRASRIMVICGQLEAEGYMEKL